MKVIKLFLLFLLLSSYTSFTQKIPDSLKQKSLRELFKGYEENTNNDIKIVYAKAFLKLAKNKKIKKRIFAGYYILSGLYDNSKVLSYSDSIISLVTSTDSKYYATVAHMTKGYYFQKNYQYNNAIDNLLQANKYAEEYGNKTLMIKIKFGIGTLKRKIKEFDEAAKLLKESLNYAKENKLNKQHLVSLIELSNIYTESENIDSAKVYIKLGKRKALSLKDTLRFNHFIFNESIIGYHEKKYESVLKKLTILLQFFKIKKKNNYLIFTHFYMGKTYDKLRRKNEMIKSYKNVDSILQIETPVIPYIREAYTNLINNYKNERDLQQQLFYVNRLIKFDSIINVNNNYVNKTIYTEYDIPKLKEEKQLIEEKLENNKALSTQIVVVLVLIIIIIIALLFYQYRRKKFYRKRVDQILNAKVKEKTKKSVEVKTYSINIPSEIIDGILLKLETFESQNKFLNNTITLNSLAKDFNTNSNYLSKIINSYKNASFNNYINSLRINYVVQELKTNNVYRKYTLKAIAEEIGFNNSESFANAFKKNTGITPSFFIKELNKN
ncbi:helix-turn-helix transcriptional regulator [Tenacibaculum agarivorans]|uniref:helix-turn-helix transcriptional regulator n=1 Tax=Tenacibaculum agarivorans TaxID=1908389 RepID=UPI0009F91C9A|nr:helix-turn-helix transcriptional regulator [Tenacibaculum agarivorans]